jgi:hypothetical protein
VESLRVSGNCANRISIFLRRQRVNEGGPAKWKLEEAAN